MTAREAMKQIIAAMHAGGGSSALASAIGALKALADMAGEDELARSNVETVERIVRDLAEKEAA